VANIYQWTWTSPKGQAGFTFLKGVDSQWAIDIKAGRTLPGPLPSEAYFEMNPERPKDVKLGEQHSNREQMVVIGSRLSEFVQGLGEQAVQLLSVKILDHKGRVASNDFNIVHTDQVIECLDTKASKAVWNTIDSTQMMSWGTLQLKAGEHKFPKVFRVKHIPSFIFIREDVAEAIEDMGLKEPYLSPLDEVGK
jgi:hypothetical protein